MSVFSYGAEIVLRKRFEEYIASKETGRKRIPVVCVALEGGISTLNSIHHYLTSTPAIPVIVCCGSGRLSDILALAERQTDDDGYYKETVLCFRSVFFRSMSTDVRQRILTQIRTVFHYEQMPAEVILEKIDRCLRNTGLVRDFRLL